METEGSEVSATAVGDQVNVEVKNEDGEADAWLSLEDAETFLDELGAAVAEARETRAEEMST